MSSMNFTPKNIAERLFEGSAQKPIVFVVTTLMTAFTAAIPGTKQRLPLNKALDTLYQEGMPLHGALRVRELLLQTIPAYAPKSAQLSYDAYLGLKNTSLSKETLIALRQEFEGKLETAIQQAPELFANTQTKPQKRKRHSGQRNFGIPKQLG